MAWHDPARVALRRELHSLAGYNDKGFEWMRHDAARIDAERASAMGRIGALVQAIGPDRLPAALTVGLADGAVASDFSGRFAEMV